MDPALDTPSPAAHLLRDGGHLRPERWDLVQDLFHQALERAPDERRAFIDRSTRDDPALRDDVLSLLRGHEREGLPEGTEDRGGPSEKQFDLVSRALPDRYALESEAGRGGMATVYRATDRKHQRTVAIKVLHPSVAYSLGVDRFLAEIETTAGLQHPHILPLFDSGEAHGYLFYVMPFVEGESLRERLDRERQLPIDDAIEIAAHMAEALDYAHRRGVIHRDIKPENVLLQEGQPVISDFGIALAVGAAREDRLTQGGYSLGTPRYMSPEQVTRDHPVGPPSDIYSLACVLHEMLVGEPPYLGGTAESVLNKIVRGLVTSPREVRKSIPANVDSTIRKGLERLPADRFKSARAFAAALADPTFRYGEAAVADAASSIRLWRSLALLFGTLLVLGAGLVMWVAPGGGPRDRAPVQRFEVTPPAGMAMLETYIGVNLALSPDGERWVYVGVGPEGQQLWQRELGSLEAVPIPWTEGAENPVFSPDGSMIAFREGEDLKTISLLGGLPNLLLDEGVTGRYIDWGPDGFIYFASDSTIARIGARGGSPEQVTDRFTGARTRLPHALPDGQGLLVTLRRDAAAQATVGVVGPGGGQIRELFPGLSARYAPSGHIVYATPDGMMMAVPFDLDQLQVTGEAVEILDDLDVRVPGLGAQFALSETGAILYRTAAISDLHTPVWVDRQGAATPVDASWRFRASIDGSSLALSPTGDRLAVSLPRGIGGGWDIWIKPLDGGTPWRLTTEGIDNRRPSWSRDGELVTYVYNDVEGREIRRKRADGVGEASVVPLGRPPSGGDGPHQPSEALFSPSGDWLVYRVGSTDNDTNPNIFAVRPGVDSVAHPLLAGDHVEWAPALSPDGRWLAYGSDETGRSEVYVRPFPDMGAAHERVSTAGGDNPVWARSGRELFYRDESDRLISVEVTLAPQLSIGASTVLFPATGFLRGQGHAMYDVSTDGEGFIMLAGEESTGTSKLILVQNWRDELRRISAR